MKCQICQSTLDSGLKDFCDDCIIKEAKRQRTKMDDAANKMRRYEASIEQAGVPDPYHGLLSKRRA